MITRMSMEALWLKLSSETREWLMAHNGEPLPADIVSAIRDAGDTSDRTALLQSDDEGGIVLSDHAVDWIEAMANGETPSVR